MINPTLALIPSAYKASKVYSILPSNGDGDFTFTRDSFATRVNSNGLIETVTEVNVPRLDYSDGGCPSLLLEPQRTNLFDYSEDFTQSYWISNEVSETLDNSQINPYGTNGSYIIESITNSGKLTAIVTVIPNTEYTLSFYAKNIDATSLRVFLTNSSVTNYFYTSQVNTDTWTRIVVNFTTGAGTSTIVQLTRDFPIGQKVYLWGAQLEQGSYATSYIPTNGDIATRTVERCNNAGNASTFNDSEGVLFIEAAALVDVGAESRWISINGGNTNNTVYINWYANDVGRMQAVVFGDGVLQANMLTGFNVVNQLEYNKIAIKYKQNDFALWINGVEVLTDTSGITPTGLNRLDFGRADNQRTFFGKVKQLQYFDTALTDLELQELTTL